MKQEHELPADVKTMLQCVADNFGALERDRAVNSKSINMALDWLKANPGNSFMKLATGDARAGRDEDFLVEVLTALFPAVARIATEHNKARRAVGDHAGYVRTMLKVLNEANE